MAKNYNVKITVYHCIYDIEAESVDEAYEMAKSDYMWDEHIMDVIIDVEESDNDN